MARPEPSKTRPSMSSDTPSFKLWLVNSTLVYESRRQRYHFLKHPSTKTKMIYYTFLTSMPEVPSNT